jgi:uroporphyrinogen decarboxylase
MRDTWACQPVPRIPFVPAVYEQKAYLIGQTPSAVARDAELFTRAMLCEYETYQADALVVGLDVYNLEAEAIGATVTFYEGDDTSIPGISGEAHCLRFGEDLSPLKIPNPAQAGRMPINLEVARRVALELGSLVPIRGAVSGPFSMALSLLGPEEFFIGTLDDPAYCKQVLAYCADVAIEFSKAYLDCGVGAILFDSQASPELFPPSMYQELVLAETQRIIQQVGALGAPRIPLIIGGNTTPMLEYYLQSGSGQILCDFSADWAQFRSACAEAGISVRRNLDPRFVHAGSPEELARRAQASIDEAEGMNGFILGTAVVPYGTPAENVLAIREVCHESCTAR